MSCSHKSVFPTQLRCFFGFTVISKPIAKRGLASKLMHVVYVNPFADSMSRSPRITDTCVRVLPEDKDGRGHSSRYALPRLVPFGRTSWTS